MTDFKKHNPFKIPDGYFESLEEKLCNSEDAVSKLNPFSTPEGYLENLENSIHKKIGISQKSAKNRLRNSTLRYTLVAAVIVFIETLNSSVDAVGPGSADPATANPVVPG